MSYIRMALLASVSQRTLVFAIVAKGMVMEITPHIIHLPPVGWNPRLKGTMRETRS